MPPRVLYVPSRADHGPYRSLHRVERSARAALAARCELVELDAHPADDPDGYLEAFRRAGPLDAVLDQSDRLLHAPLTPLTPTLLWALGNMTNGATLPWLRRRRLKTTDVLLVNCTSDLAIHERVLGGTGPAAELLPLAVDTDRFRPRGAAAARALRDRLGVPPDAFLMLYAGRLNIQKNLHSLLLVLRELAARDPRPHLVLAGAFDELAHSQFEVTNQGYEALLRELVRGWGLADRVHWLGAVDDDEELAGWYAAADVVATLSLHNNENFGYAAVEAMAAGTPVVASHFGGLKDTVVDGETGFHVETLMTDHGLRAAWRQALGPLRRLLAEPELRSRLGAAARARAVARYGEPAFAAALAAIVERAAARARREPGRPGATFRFAPEALRLHLRNLHRTLAREDGRERRGPRVEYDVYRWFQGPYATRDVRDASIGDDDPLALVTRTRLDRAGGAVASLDPIWPRRHPLAPAELETLAALEPGTTLAALVARGRERGLERPAVEALVRRLIVDGVIWLDRPFRP